MQPPSSNSPRLRFGAFVLDPASGQLRKNNTLVRLPPQPFRLLQLLTERPGTVVTREEIQKCLWKEATFVDFEHGINFSINQIRGALADDAEKPRYVETLPRRSYRVIARVEVLNGNKVVSGTRDSAEDTGPIDTATFQFPTIFVGPSEPSDADPQAAPSQPVSDSRLIGKGRWLAIAATSAIGLIAAILLIRGIY